jgi:metal-sulfur cluster biosynthetic enzyme
MVMEEQVRKDLGVVLVPGANRSVVALNLVRGITISDGEVKIVLASTGLMLGAQDWVQSQAREAIQKLSEVKGVTVEYNDAKAKELNKINYIFAVMSGKGGVGKLLLSSSEARKITQRDLQDA